MRQTKLVGLVIATTVAAGRPWPDRSRRTKSVENFGTKNTTSATVTSVPAVARKAEGLTDPISATDEDLLKGMRLYRDGCAGCHGSPGKPSRWGQSNFYPPAPQLAERGVHDPVPEIFVVVMLTDWSATVFEVEYALMSFQSLKLPSILMPFSPVNTMM